MSTRNTTEMHQRARRKEENWKIRQKHKQRIDILTPMTNTWLTRKYLGQVRKRKKQKLNNIRRDIIGLIRQVIVRKYGGRTRSNQSKNITYNSAQERIFNNNTSIRQPSSSGSLFAMLRSNKRYKPVDYKSSWALMRIQVIQLVTVRPLSGSKQ